MSKVTRMKFFGDGHVEELITETPPSAAAPTGVVNTDRELWRETPGDFYAPSLHVTEQGGIGIDVGGSVFVKPIREWHKLAAPTGVGDAKPLTRGERNLILAGLAEDVHDNFPQRYEATIRELEARLATRAAPTGDADRELLRDFVHVSASLINAATSASKHSHTIPSGYLAALGSLCNKAADVLGTEHAGPSPETATP